MDFESKQGPRMHLVFKLAATLVFAAVPLLAQTQPAPPKPPSPRTPPTPSQQVAHREEQPQDWPNLHRYQFDNAALPPASPDTHHPNTARVVFYGDSITDGWGRLPDTGTFFPGKPYINRGISGQTTPQMLVRFQQDVVHLHPAAVVILAGTNDIAGNTGPSTPQMIEDNFISMAEIARSNGIKVILASITPAYSYPWKSGIDPVPTIREVNQWLKNYCAREGFVYLDYYSALSDDKGAMKSGLAKDGVHPTAAGYAVMQPLAEAAIAQALK
jgi:lysophospholipase L1-like esterase